MHISVRHLFQWLGVLLVHPGYGFLSENIVFVVELEKAGVKFIGPHSKVRLYMLLNMSTC